LRTYQEVLQLARLSGDQALEGKSLLEIAHAYRDAGNNEQALLFYENALALGQVLGNVNLRKDALTDAAKLYALLDRPEQALRTYEQAYALAQEIGDQGAAGEALVGRGRAYLRLGQCMEALQSYQDALITAQRSNLGDLANTAQIELGKYYRDQGDAAQALTAMQAVLDAAIAIDDLPTQAWALTEIGRAHRDLGDYAAAQQHYAQAIVLAQRLGDVGLLAQIQIDRSKVLRLNGQAEEAVQTLQSMQPTQWAAGQSTTLSAATEGAILVELARAYAALQEYEQALQAYEQALTLARSQGTRTGVPSLAANDATVEGEILLGRGQMQAQLQQYAEGSQAYEAVLTLARVTGNLSLQARGFEGLGSLYRASQQHSQSLINYQKALPLVQQLVQRSACAGAVNPGWEAQIQKNIGKAYQALGQLDEALVAYGEVQALAVRQENAALANALGDWQCLSLAGQL